MVADDSRATPMSLAASEQRFKLLVESVVDYAIFILDPRGVILTWNAGAERI
jgi:PAS domain-containing protein